MALYDLLSATWFVHTNKFRICWSTSLSWQLCLKLWIQNFLIPNLFFTWSVHVKCRFLYPRYVHYIHYGFDSFNRRHEPSREDVYISQSLCEMYLLCTCSTLVVQTRNVMINFPFNFITTRQQLKYEHAISQYHCVHGHWESNRCNKWYFN